MRAKHQLIVVWTVAILAGIGLAIITKSASKALPPPPPAKETAEWCKTHQHVAYCQRQELLGS